MVRKKKISIEEEREKKFREIKRRTEIKERYGVFTQKMFENLLEELRIRIKEDIKQKLDPLNDKLDWLIGAYKKFDEEHTLLNSRISNHEDRIEKVEKKLGIYAN
ncbi:hypothetical protein MUP56_01960 [Patescibacteria group bacterium]|nr:hypothetical protein [Patescibacteria group bacterium]